MESITRDTPIRKMRREPRRALEGQRPSRPFFLRETMVRKGEIPWIHLVLIHEGAHFLFQ